MGILGYSSQKRKKFVMILPSNDVTEEESNKSGYLA
jgi:hypothetical protein